jgi:hypothetical protein
MEQKSNLNFSSNPEHPQSLSLTTASPRQSIHKPRASMNPDYPNQRERSQITQITSSHPLPCSNPTRSTFFRAATEHREEETRLVSEKEREKE